MGLKPTISGGRYHYRDLDKRAPQQLQFDFVRQSDKSIPQPPKSHRADDWADLNPSAVGWPPIPPRTPKPLFGDDDFFFINPTQPEPNATKYRCRGCDHHFEAVDATQCPLCDYEQLVVRQ